MVDIDSIPGMMLHALLYKLHRDAVQRPLRAEW